MNLPASPASRSRPWLNVVLAAAIGVAVAGFAVGIEATDTPQWPRYSTSPSSSSQAIATPSYLQWRQRGSGPSSHVTSPLQKLRAGFPKLGDPVVLTEQAKAAALAGRAKRRAFDGAPPGVPHPIDEQSAASCLSCHQAGMKLEGRTASVMSHQKHTSCTQCHVPMAGRPGAAKQGRANSFVGLPSAESGPRAWQGAPPAVPHPVFMRENCASCHGLTGAEGLRTTHPERASCLQCHAPNQTEAP